MSDRKRDLVQAAVDCQKALAQLDKGFRTGLYEQLQEIYSIAEDFSDDDEAYVRFGKQEFWEKCKKAKPKVGNDRNTIILLVTRLAFRAVKTQGTRYNRAYKHARTLQRYARQGVPWEEVAQKLEKEHGSDYAFQLEIQEHPRRATKEDVRAEGDDETVESGDEQSGSEPRSQPTRAKGDASISKSTTPRLSPDGEPVLDVEISSERLERVLSLPEGGKARIKVEHRGSLGSWKRIVAIAVKALEN